MDTVAATNMFLYLPRSKGPHKRAVSASIGEYNVVMLSCMQNNYHSMSGRAKARKYKWFKKLTTLAFRC